MTYYNLVGDKAIDSNLDRVYSVHEHMDIGYRAVLLLQEAGIEDLMKTEKQNTVFSSLRLFGYIVGRLRRIQEINCGRDFESAHDKAFQFVANKWGMIEK